MEEFLQIFRKEITTLKEAKGISINTHYKLSNIINSLENYVNIELFSNTGTSICGYLSAARRIHVTTQSEQMSNSEEFIQALSKNTEAVERLNEIDISRR